MSSHYTLSSLIRWLSNATRRLISWMRALFISRVEPEEVEPLIRYSNDTSFTGTFYTSPPLESPVVAKLEYLECKCDGQFKCRKPRAVKGAILREKTFKAPFKIVDDKGEEKEVLFTFHYSETSGSEVVHEGEYFFARLMPDEEEDTKSMKAIQLEREQDENGRRDDAIPHGAGSLDREVQEEEEPEIEGDKLMGKFGFIDWVEKTPPSVSPIRTLQYITQEIEGEPKLMAHFGDRATYFMRNYHYVINVLMELNEDCGEQLDPELKRVKEETQLITELLFGKIMDEGFRILKKDERRFSSYEADRVEEIPHIVRRIAWNNSG
ncbi:hypothetical protein BJ508DRAFT_343624 [Ascobolus immersus RN42]|uniref:Uncharacterized protein n=1 Tax=Ascobolus immersus RN42 TaxID=1160509 RepID=A0A3N4IF74_ASCIM|nr:hypothetical protein BJ508DRAFT_343624 [Ascobolus immersus RN42]